METIWCTYCARDCPIRRIEEYMCCIDCGKVTDADQIMNADYYAAKLRRAAKLCLSDSSEEQSTLDQVDVKGIQSDSESDFMDTDNKEHDSKAGVTYGAADLYYGSEEEDEEEYGSDLYDGSDEEDYDSDEDNGQNKGR